jgi:hypothetical protein
MVSLAVDGSAPRTARRTHRSSTAA